jgi:hypothetical protein
MHLCVTQAAKKLQAKELFQGQMRENLNFESRLEPLGTFLISALGAIETLKVIHDLNKARLANQKS